MNSCGILCAGEDFWGRADFEPGPSPRPGREKPKTVAIGLSRRGGAIVTSRRLTRDLSTVTRRLQLGGLTPRIVADRLDPGRIGSLGFWRRR
jgi:hypothetical protein